jgi:ribosome-associated protein
MKKDDVRAQVAIAVQACIEKKAEDISILRLDAQASGFTDYFVICSAANPRQVQAIGDEVDEKLSKLGYEPSHVEGRNQAEWLLLDYVDFVVHIFSESARKFYDLERLWKTATRLQLADLEKPEPKRALVAAKRAPAKKTATKSGVKKSAHKTAAVKRGHGPTSKRTRKGK